MSQQDEERRELLPCPFCGCTVIKSNGWSYFLDYTVECQQCHATVTEIYGEKEAIALWNRRAPEHEKARREENMSELDKLAFKIAERASRETIESACPTDSSGMFYRLDQLEEIDRETVTEAVRFLDLQGRIERHPSNDQFIVIRE